MDEPTIPSTARRILAACLRPRRAPPCSAPLLLKRKPATSRVPCTSSSSRRRGRRRAREMIADGLFEVSVRRGVRHPQQAGVPLGHIITTAGPCSPPPIAGTSGHHRQGSHAAHPHPHRRSNGVGANIDAGAADHRVSRNIDLIIRRSSRSGFFNGGRPANVILATSISAARRGRRHRKIAGR